MTQELQQIIEIALNNFTGNLEDKPDFIAKAIIDSRALRTGGVKPLELNWSKRSETDYLAETPIGRFWIYEDEPGVWALNLRAIELGTFKTLKEAQDFAQTHFNSLIGSCLTDEPEYTEKQMKGFAEWIQEYGPRKRSNGDQGIFCLTYTEPSKWAEQKLINAHEYEWDFTGVEYTTSELLTEYLTSLKHPKQ